MARGDLVLEVGEVGLLFDSDGVLVDSDACVVEAWTAWSRHYGLDPEDVLPRVHGHPSRETVAELLPPEDQDEALAMVDRLELEAAGSVRPMPGALELLTVLPTRSWVVVTSGTSALVRARLSAAGLPQPFALVTADDVSRGKPEADPYLAGSRQVGRQPAACVVFEDAGVGVASARAAGVATVVGVGRDTADHPVDAFVPDLSVVRYDGRLHVPDHR